MDKALEDVLAEALETLEHQEVIDVDAYIQRYPEMAEDLQKMLPLIVSVRTNRELHRAALKTSAHAKSLFSELSSNARAEHATVGALLRSELHRSGVPLEEKAAQMGLPEKSLRELLDDETPADTLDNPTIKRLADQVAAPVGAMVKELRRLVALYRSSGLGSAPQLAFTRSNEESSSAEKQQLVDRVRRQDLPGDRPPSRG